MEVKNVNSEKKKKTINENGELHCTGSEFQFDMG